MRRLALLLLVGASSVHAGAAADEGVRAASLMWDTHPTVYAVLAALCALAASVYGLRRVLVLIRG